jgi:hypothetical protein
MVFFSDSIQLLAANMLAANMVSNGFVKLPQLTILLPTWLE